MSACSVWASKSFSELTGTDDAGRPLKFSLQRAASTIHDEVTERNQCYVYRADDKTGHPLIEVDFTAAEYSPRASSAPDGQKENIFYPIVVYAKTHGQNSATLFFKCRLRNPPEGQPCNALRSGGRRYSTPSHVAWPSNWGARVRRLCRACAVIADATPASVRRCVSQKTGRAYRVLPLATKTRLPEAANAMSSASSCRS